jgi:hypothetical protein
MCSCNATGNDARTPELGVDRRQERQRRDPADAGPRLEPGGPQVLLFALGQLAVEGPSMHITGSFSAATTELAWQRLNLSRRTPGLFSIH